MNINSRGMIQLVAEIRSFEAMESTHNAGTFTRNRIVRSVFPVVETELFEISSLGMFKLKAPIPGRFATEPRPWGFQASVD